MVKKGSKLFQSLTGSIHTDKYASYGVIVIEFQSLTGSIHTVIKILIQNGTIIVSIPHRYDSHMGKSCLYRGTIRVSIPHRYDSHKDN
nr:hypothetical protein [Candidatus Kryptobacter tengchongensis]